MSSGTRGLLAKLVASAALALVGCGSVTATPDPDAAVEDGDAAIVDADVADPDAPDAAAVCGGENQCVSIPQGWTGPVTYAAQAGEPPACAAGYPTQELAAHQGLNPGTPTCGCTCGAINLTCGTVQGIAYKSTSCADPQGSIAMGINTCRLASTYTTASSFNFDLSKATGSCGAPTVTKTIPTPTWATKVRVCGGAQDAVPGACGQDAICAPPAASPYGNVCIYQKGDHACPAEFSAERELVFDDFSDTRTCSTCTCSAQNATCTATVTRYQNAQNNCSGTSATLTVTESGSGCITKASQTSFQTTAITKNPSAACVKQGGTATGSAAPIQPTTICCR